MSLEPFSEFDLKKNYATQPNVAEKFGLSGLGARLIPGMVKEKNI